jgi:tetratricopeptide (TPR) repeat protein
MAAKKRNDDENTDGHGAEFDGEGDESSEDFYQSEVSRYEATVDRDLDEAFKRYGFTLYHSLPPVKQVQLAKKLGFMVNDAVDHFNLAGVEIASEHWTEAAKLLQKALELDGTFADAAYNLALVYEKLDRKSDAINLWSRFQELAQGDDDRKSVDAHLAELRG